MPGLGVWANKKRRDQSNRHVPSDTRVLCRKGYTIDLVDQGPDSKGGENPSYEILSLSN